MLTLSTNGYKKKEELSTLLSLDAGVIEGVGCLVGSTPTTFAYTQALVTVRALGGERARA